CRQCKKLFRSDHVADMLKEAEWVGAFAEALGADAARSVTFDAARAKQWAGSKGKKLAPGQALVRKFQVTLDAMASALGSGPASPDLVLSYAATEPGVAPGLSQACPNCGGDLTEPRQFNLMFESHAGAVQDDASKVYLRPETAQGIFLNYKNVLD